MHAILTIFLVLRAAWIATVVNIDWPQVESVGNDSAQRAEMITILDSLEALHFNAVIFQIRPTADALYISELEPLSQWIGSVEYDPLDFVIAEAHKRQMEVHAWVNPYRITLKDKPMYMPGEKNENENENENGNGNQNRNGNYIESSWEPIYLQHPEWLMFYGGQWFFDPGLDETRDWICGVVEDIVCRYPVDAIHMDDYFYPYPVAGKTLPDEGTFRQHPRGFTSIHDWRRNNTNMVIQALSERIHSTRPTCRFGISPFGINEKNYNELYADIEHWLEEGWIDYVAPQLYWEIGHKTADYDRLVRWWAEHSHGRDLYIGLADYRLGTGKANSAWQNGNEIVRQMRLNRSLEAVGGECFYSTRPLLNNPQGICDSLRIILP